jgi:hypothetical protein
MSDAANAAPSADFAAAKAAFEAAHREYTEALLGAAARNARNLLEDPDVKEKCDRMQVAWATLQNARRPLSAP